MGASLVVVNEALNIHCGKEQRIEYEKEKKFWEYRKEITKIKSAISV